ncbi:MAG: SDR family oxidoreductase [Acidobacteriaceae bacterium]|nr:SDR family oxidoreductase [Acidobacteriaceae bacterium]
MPTALITGASIGLGREFARICARDGLDVVLTARSEPQLESLADEIRRETGRTAVVLARDLSYPAAPREIFDDLGGRGIAIDVLINNAGFGLNGLSWQLPYDECMKMIQVNITALTALTRLFLPVFVQRRSGRILNIASTAAFQPGPLMAVYYATKAYVLSFSEAIHNEARDFGVTVTCLCPGATKTEFDKRAGMANSRLFTSGRAMDAATVAQIGYDAMMEGKPEVIAGGLNALIAFSTRFASRQTTASIARRFQESA